MTSEKDSYDDDLKIAWACRKACSSFQEQYKLSIDQNIRVSYGLSPELNEYIINVEYYTNVMPTIIQSLPKFFQNYQIIIKQISVN
jgi:hypothetical protein